MNFNIAIDNRRIIDGQIVSDASKSTKFVRNLRDIGIPTLIGTVAIGSLTMFGLMIANMSGVGKVNHTIRVIGCFGFGVALISLASLGFAIYRSVNNHKAHKILNQNREYNENQMSQAIGILSASSYWSTCCFKFTLGDKELETRAAIITSWSTHIASEVAKEIQKDNIDLDRAEELFSHAHYCVRSPEFNKDISTLRDKIITSGDWLTSFVHLMSPVV